MAVREEERQDQHDAHVRKFDARVRVPGKKALEKGRVAEAKADDEGKRTVHHRMVQDPAVSDAEYFHQRQSKSGPYVGKVAVAMNMVEYVGGLCRLSGTSETQIMAAAKYRMIYDRAQIGGARAIDYSAVKVDSSGPRDDLLAGKVADNLEAYKSAVRHIGMIASAMVERVICHDHPLTNRGMGARARARARDDLFAALDDLAVHFQLVTRKAA